MTDEKTKKQVSILMLTHNAPEYVELSIRSVRERTKGISYELIVLDNASENETVSLVGNLHKEGLIDKLKLLDYNSLFAEGNNIAARLASTDSSYFLLLNSDIEVKSPDWLSHLLGVHKRGMTSYGLVGNPRRRFGNSDQLPLRVDGFCLLIDRDLYEKVPLDEAHQWWYAVTKQQARLLQDGWNVQGYESYGQWLHHFGGKSGTAFKTARGMNVTPDELLSWFGDKAVHALGCN
ncbi:MAG TPA: glycosyltransferase [Nitrosospira sp.]|nr:glycosyltransferase [Nitrosospira sp.]